MRRRHTPPAPLKRGVLRCCFFVGNELFECVSFPSGEGIEGCVTVRGAGWDEMIFEVVSVDFGWLLLILGSCAWASHTPCPSREGRSEYCFLFDI